MGTMVLFIVFVALFVLSFFTSFFAKKRAGKTTYNELLKQSREFIDKGQYDKLRTYLNARYRLVLLHHDELVSLLSEYARNKDGDINKKN